MKAIVQSVPMNSALHHWVGQEVEVTSSRNFSIGKLHQLKNKEGLTCELMDVRIKFLD
mgnify:FL=1